MPLSGNAPVIDSADARATTRRTSSSPCCVVRGRVSAACSRPALVDLGKPAFKLGVAEIHVGWRAHELEGQGDADAQVYQVRDKARVKVAVRTRRRQGAAAGERGRARGGRRRPARAAPQRFAGNLLDAMMQPRGYRSGDLDGADAGDRQAPLRAQGAAAGRRRRAADARASCSTRCCSGTARVPLDANGDARTVEMPLNDSLTSLPHRRGRARAAPACSAPARQHPLDAGPDAAVRPAAAGARGRPLPRRCSRCATPRDEPIDVTVDGPCGGAQGRRSRRSDRPRRRGGARRSAGTSRCPSGVERLKLGDRRGRRAAAPSDRVTVSSR